MVDVVLRGREDWHRSLASLGQRRKRTAWWWSRAGRELRRSLSGGGHCEGCEVVDVDVCQVEAERPVRLAQLLIVFGGSGVCCVSV